MAKLTEVNMSLQTEEDEVARLEKILQGHKRRYNEEDMERIRVEKQLDEAIEERKALEALIVRNPERLLRAEQDEQDKVSTKVKVKY